MRGPLLRPGALAPVVLLAVASCARPDAALLQLREDRRAIAAVLDAYGEAVARGRIERLDSLFVRDGVQLFQNHAPLEGRDEILRWWEGVVAQRASENGPLRGHTRVVEIEVAGTQAYAVGSFEELPAALARPADEAAGPEAAGPERGAYAPDDSTWMASVPIADSVLGAEPMELRRFKFLAVLVRDPGPGGSWRILRHSLSSDGRYRLP